MSHKRKQPEPKAKPEDLIKGKEAHAKEQAKYKAQATMVVYCDGSCLGNGKNGADAGYGVFFGDSPAISGYNVSEPLSGPRQTNQEAELRAVYEIFLLVSEDLPLIIKSDSDYAQNVLTKWMSGWKKNGWTKADGEAPVNLAIVKKLDKLWTTARQANTEFVWVPAHTERKRGGMLFCQATQSHIA
jgi:ribonuclease HI